MHKKEEKLVNIRSLFVVMVALMLGIAFGRLQEKLGFYASQIIAVYLGLAIIFLLCLFFFRTKRAFYLITAFAIVFLLGVILFQARVQSYRQAILISDYDYIISGKVIDKTKRGQRDAIILGNLLVGNEPLSGKMLVYLTNSSGEWCEIGDRIRFQGMVEQFDLFFNGRFFSLACEDVRYSSTAYSGMQTIEQGFSLLGTIRSKIYDTLYENLEGDIASVAYAMLTGNTTMVDEGMMTSFRYGGIAHIFAVSGLHIGLVVGSVRSILKFVHIKRIASYCVALLCGLLVCGISGYTPSAVRAMIMCTIFSIFTLATQKSDGITVMSISAIILLIMQPLNLFSIGFQLSFGAVFSISFLSVSFRRLFRFLPYKIGQSIATCFAAQLGVMPFMAYYFGYLSWASIFLNIIFIPILSTVYSLLFFGVVISVIFPAIANICLLIFALPLKGFISLFSTIPLEKAIISGYGFMSAAVFYILFLAFITDKINFKKWIRIAGLSVTVFAMVICSVLPKVWKGEVKVIVSGWYQSGFVLVRTQQGDIVIINEKTSYSHCNQAFSKYDIHPDFIFLVGGDSCMQNYITLNLSADKVFVSYDLLPISEEMERIQNIQNYGIDFNYYNSKVLEFSINQAQFCYASEEYHIGSDTIGIGNYFTEHEQAIRYDSEIYHNGDLQILVKEGIIKAKRYI